MCVTVFNNVYALCIFLDTTILPSSLNTYYHGISYSTNICFIKKIQSELTLYCTSFGWVRSPLDLVLAIVLSFAVVCAATLAALCASCFALLSALNSALLFPDSSYFINIIPISMQIYTQLLRFNIEIRAISIK